MLTFLRYYVISKVKKIVTTYPKTGVSCYSTWGKLLHLI